MADVYEGVDTRLGRTVAIKLLKADLANDPNFEARFRQEAQASARMAHPTIVRVYDAGEDVTVDSNGNTNRHPFIVMEYVNGKLLRDLLHERRLTLQEVIDFETGVLTALEFSHRAGIVHRDIKSANVMITEAGQVKVMDFGIARAVSENSATVAHTSGIVGTAQYFSPEQAKGESVDARTDLYSAGVLLYEMLAGRPPFKGESAVSVAYQHVSEAVVPPSEFDPNVSAEMDSVVLRALAKDRNERFQTAEEFREHLLAAYTVVLENTPDELPAHALAFEPEPVVETPSIDLAVEDAEVEAPAEAEPTSTADELAEPENPAFAATQVLSTGFDEFDALLALMPMQLRWLRLQRLRPPLMLHRLSHQLHRFQLLAKPSQFQQATPRQAPRALAPTRSPNSASSCQPRLSRPSNTFRPNDRRQTCFGASVLVSLWFSSASWFGCSPSTAST
jgi:serine/threonine protein kinase